MMCCVRMFFSMFSPEYSFFLLTLDFTKKLLSGKRQERERKSDGFILVGIVVLMTML